METDGLAAEEATEDAVTLGLKSGNPPGNEIGKVCAAAAAAAAWTVADNERREVDSGGMQGATLPVEDALRAESLWVKEEVRRAAPL